MIKSCVIVYWLYLYYIGHGIIKPSNHQNIVLVHMDRIIRVARYRLSESELEAIQTMDSGFIQIVLRFCLLSYPFFSALWE